MTAERSAEWLAAEDNLVGPSDASHRVWIDFRLEVAHNSWTKWRSRHADFPEPAKSISGGPVYRYDELVDWLADTGRIEQ